MAGGSQNRIVCKFFLEGRCKFGNRCRFSHSTGDTGYNNRDWGGGGHNKSGDYGQSRSNDFNRGWGNKQQGGNRFQLFSDSGDGQGQGYQNRDTSQRHNPFNRLGPRNDQEGRNAQGHQNQNSFQRRNPFERLGPTNDSQDRWRSGGQNRYESGQHDRWDNGQQGRWGGNQHRQDKWRGGGDKWASGQDHWDGGYNRRDNRQSGSEQPTSPRDIADSIKMDMEEWAVSGMWPLSCYAYYKETPCLPGLADVSLEEVRWEAYQAKVSGNSASYLQNLNQLGEKQMKVQRQYGNITADDVRSMQSNPDSFLSRSDSGSSGSLFGPADQASTTLFPKPSILGDPSTAKSSIFQPANSGPTLFGPTAQPAAASSIFSQPSVPAASVLMDQQITTQPSVTQPQSSSSTADSGKKTLKDILNHTQTRKPTKEELEAYSADKFVLGQIPEHAPPIA